MAHKYQKHTSTKKTSQSQAIFGRENDMKKNRAGGFAFKISDWKRLERFLILGSEKDTYYASAQEMTVENAQNVLSLIEKDGKGVVDKVVEISDAGRAAKNDPALFALAMVAGLGDNTAKKYALDNLPKVARIGTHLFTFVDYVSAFRGWGRALRKGIANWYLSKDVEKLTYQTVKYQQRGGWSHRDLLRLAHVKPVDKMMDDLFAWITHGIGDTRLDDGKEVPVFPFKVDDLKNLPLVYGFERAKRAENETEVIKLIEEFKLPHEAIPTEYKNKPAVQEALLPNMPMTALIRNLGNLSKSGLMVNGATEIVNMAVEKITDPVALKKARIHPIAVLSALTTYRSGHGHRGSGEWEVVRKVVDALDRAFYLSFGNVEPTGKRIMLALDISSSMTWQFPSGLPSVSAREASAAMAMVTARTEDEWMVTGFHHRLMPLNISSRQRLDDITDYISTLDFGSTDCSLPMTWALQNGRNFDAFVVYTDNETWSGNIHPNQALMEYRQKTGINAKLIVVGVTATDVSIADPNDGGMLDVVGFDTAAPQIIGDFIKGTI